MNNKENIDNMNNEKIVFKHSKLSQEIPDNEKKRNTPSNSSKAIKRQKIFHQNKPKIIRGKMTPARDEAMCTGFVYFRPFRVSYKSRSEQWANITEEVNKIDLEKEHPVATKTVRARMDSLLESYSQKFKAYHQRGEQSMGPLNSKIEEKLYQAWLTYQDDVKTKTYKKTKAEENIEKICNQVEQQQAVHDDYEQQDIDRKDPITETDEEKAEADEDMVLLKETAREKRMRHQEVMDILGQSLSVQKEILKVLQEIRDDSKK